MNIHNVVAIYPSRAIAETARQNLLETGVKHDSIRLSEANEKGPNNGPVNKDQNEGWFEWMFGSDLTSENRAAYSSQLNGEHTAVAVRVDDNHLSEIETLLEKLNPIDLELDESVTEKDRTTHADGASQTEQVIPIVKEELNVGKRTVERRHRIQTRIIEEPIEKLVNLRSERVTIERRPASGSAPIDPAQIKDIEVVERHEEPVVAKTGRVVEEVVIGKKASERTEAIRDTVRHTEVDVDENGTAEKRAKPR